MRCCRLVDLTWNGYFLIIWAVYFKIIVSFCYSEIFSYIYIYIYIFALRFSKKFKIWNSHSFLIWKDFLVVISRVVDIQEEINDSVLCLIQININLFFFECHVRSPWLKMHSSPTLRTPVHSLIFLNQDCCFRPSIFPLRIDWSSRYLLPVKMWPR